MQENAFFDTTGFYSARDLNTASWRKIADAISQGILSAATSTVVVQEATRQSVNGVSEQFRKAAEVAKKLGQFGVSFPVPSRPSESEVENRLPNWLDRAGVEVRVIPQVSHQGVLDRDLDIKPPFEASGSGKGYRDTLIWLTLLEWARELHGNGVTSAFFITSNTKDFCGPFGELKPELSSELPDGFEVKVLSKPQDLSDLIELPVPPSNEEVVTSAALRLVGSDLVGETVERSNFATHYQTIDLIEELTITAVTAEYGEAQQLDLLDGEEQLWSVEVRCSLSLEGYVHKGDVGHVDGIWSVSHPDWNTHYAEVVAEVEATAIVTVRLHADEEDTDTELESVEVL